MLQPLPAPLPKLGSLPIELAEMRLTSTGADGEPIPNGSDVCNLLLMNRMLQAASFETLDKFLTVVKHPVLGAYVREVAIGPGRINTVFVEEDDHLRSDDDPRCSNGLIDYLRDPLTVAHFRKPVSARDISDANCDPASEYAVILGQALKTFPNLRVIRLDSYMDTVDKERRPRNIGADVSSRSVHDCNSMLSPRTLVYWRTDAECMYMDYELILHALYHIKDDPDWTLKFQFDFTHDDDRKVVEKTKLWIWNLSLSTRQYGRCFAPELRL
ncbi:hypothetical protein E8E12_008982 [Didymella heteroderae]|uniref:Uncharacterized protein n=1 Tax=Didymella heteroderae TaxID=1769908 RepID=A0A9P4WYE7_9PLEO|nr:hypothetical protein E8E12_008982 [Didymella heteroderae]